MDRGTSGQCAAVDSVQQWTETQVDSVQQWTEAQVWGPIHCTMYSTQHTKQCTGNGAMGLTIVLVGFNPVNIKKLSLCVVFSEQYSLSSIQGTVFRVQYSGFSIPCALLRVQYSVLSIQCAVLCVKYSVCSADTDNP